jgi:hypothetical protein
MLMFQVDLRSSEEIQRDGQPSVFSDMSFCKCILDKRMGKVGGREHHSCSRAVHGAALRVKHHAYVVHV